MVVCSALVEVERGGTAYRHFFGGGTAYRHFFLTGIPPRNLIKLVRVPAFK